MDLTPYVDNLRYELAVAAEAGGDQDRELVERLTVSLDSSARLTLLAALSAAADEITRELAPDSVDVRLRDRDAEFVVTQHTRTVADPAAPPGPAQLDDDGAMTRINLRLSENVKARIEEAAGRAGLSANAWLVRAAATALAEDDRPAVREIRRGRQHYSGWVR